MSSWTSLVIDELCELKRSGVLSFDDAWAEVTAAHPPRGLWPRDKGDNDQVAWLEKVARDAWEDKQPALRAFPQLWERVL